MPITAPSSSNKDVWMNLQSAQARWDLQQAECMRALKETYDLLASELQKEGFAHPNRTLPGHDDDVFRALAKDRVHLSFVPFPESGSIGLLRVDVVLDATGNSEGRFSRGSCGRLNFLLGRDDVRIAPGSIEPALAFVREVFPEGARIARERERVLGESPDEKSAGKLREKAGRT